MRELKNNGELEILWLGVGSAFAKDNKNTNFIIIKGDTHLLVDFGITGPAALVEHGINSLDIENVYITHAHSDHIGGLEWLCQMNMFVGRPQGKPKLKLWNTTLMSEVFWEYTLSGGLGQTDLGVMTYDDYFDVKGDVNGFMEFDIGDLNVKVYPTNHVPDMRADGLLIDNRVFYSGDSTFDKDAIMEHKDVDVIYHDVAFFRGGVHAALDELRTLPDDIKSKMLLVHYGDNHADYDVSEFLGFETPGSRQWSIKSDVHDEC